MSRRLLNAIIVALAAGLLLILAFGGIDLQLGRFAIRVHGWIRPAVLLLIALATRFWVDRARPSLGIFASLSLAALLVAISIVYLQHHVRVAGGLDSYGYVSAASLLASGKLTAPQKLAGILPFDSAPAAAAPLGHVVARDGRSSAPRFPLGLPAVMALFSVFGMTAVFFVPLVAGFGVIALAARLGREPDVTASALLAAILVAADPLMMHYATQPMSDVPAAFWLLLALWLRLAQPRWSIAAGLCAAMALLTRPALVPACVAVGLVTAPNRPRRETIEFFAGVTIAVAVQLALNRRLYGSATLSGYGTVGHMFEISGARITANIRNFGRWLTYSHTIGFWVLWPVALFVLRRRPWAWQMSAVAAAAAAPYLLYLVFDDWESSRFLLAAIVIVFILFARALAVALAGRPRLWYSTAVALAFLWAGFAHVFLQREGVYRFGSVEAKYVLAGDWFKSHTPERAVVLAGLHSGSIRMYGARETIRWDEIPPDKLDETLMTLRAAGYDPYLVLDVPSEPPLFEARFGGRSTTTVEQVARVRVVNIYRFVSAH